MRAFDAYGVAILTVTDGKVTDHVDYIDYETIDRAVGRSRHGLMHCARPRNHPVHAHCFAPRGCSA